MSGSRIIPFLRRQVVQMQEGGIRIFFRKIKKSFDFLLMYLLAPAAVRLRIVWPQGYYFVWTNLWKRLRKIRSTPDERMVEKSEKIEKRIIDCIERYIAQKPNVMDTQVWLPAINILFALSYSKESFEKAIGILQNFERARHQLMRDHQFNELDFEFIPVELVIGNFGALGYLEVYIKARVLGLRPSKKLVLLFDPESRANNPCYFKYWRQYLTVISDPLLIQALIPLEKWMTVPINYYMSFQGRTILTELVPGLVREQWNEQKRPALLKLSWEDFERGWKCLNSLGVPQDAWFVCLHVREGGWNDNKYEANYRNADIKTYLPSIKAITDAGGWVIRMGDPSMTPLPKMDHVIDYAHNDAKSDWMDIFLGSQCRFLVGTSSGVFTISIAFGVPLVITNYLNAATLYQFSSDTIFIPKLCLSKDDNHILSFNELLSPPVSIAVDQHVYDRLNLKAIENTPEEIEDVVMEMLMRVSGTLQYSQEDQYLQKQFKSLSARCGKFHGDGDLVINGRIGRDFLRKYSSLLPSDKPSNVSMEF